MKTLFLLYCTLDEHPRRFNQIIRKMAGVKLSLDILNGKITVKSRADFIERRSEYKKKIRKSWISEILKLLCQKGLVQKISEGYRLIKPNVWSFMIGTGVVDLDKVDEIEGLLEKLDYKLWEDHAKIALLDHNPKIMFGRDKGRRLLEVINYRAETKHEGISDNEVLSLSDLPPDLREKLKKRVATGYTPWWDAVWNEEKLRFYVESFLNGETCVMCLQRQNELWKIYKAKHETKFGKGVKEKIACENPDHKGPICFMKTRAVKVDKRSFVKYELAITSGGWSYHQYVPQGFILPWI